MPPGIIARVKGDVSCRASCSAVYIKDPPGYFMFQLNLDLMFKI